MPPLKIALKSKFVGHITMRHSTSAKTHIHSHNPHLPVNSLFMRAAANKMCKCVFLYVFPLVPVYGEACVQPHVYMLTVYLFYFVCTFLCGHVFKANSLSKRRCIGL